MLDQLPAWLRHLLLVLVPPVLGWIASDVVPALQGHGGVSAIAASAISMLLLVLTPWFTTQYGVGATSGD